MMRDIPAKLSFVLLCWVSALVLPVPAQLFLILMVLALTAFTAPLRPVSLAARKTFHRFLLYAAILALLVVLLNAAFTRSGAALGVIGPIRFDADGAAFGIRVSARLILMSTAILSFFLSTPLRLFAQYLERSGVPMVLTSVLLLSLDFLERIPSRIDQIFTSQEARGAPVREGVWARLRNLISVLGPLVLSSLVESIERSHALELRGFHFRRRTPASTLPRSHTPVVAGLLLLTALILAWGLWQLLSR